MKLGTYGLDTVADMLKVARLADIVPLAGRRTASII